MKFAIVHPGTMYTQGYTKNDHRGCYLSQTNPIQTISFYFVYLPLATTNPPPFPISPKSPFCHFMYSIKINVFFSFA